MTIRSRRSPDLGFEQTTHICLTRKSASGGNGFQRQLCFRKQLHRIIYAQPNYFIINTSSQHAAELALERAPRNIQKISQITDIGVLIDMFSQVAKRQTIVSSSNAKTSVDARVFTPDGLTSNFFFGGTFPFIISDSMDAAS